MALRSRVVTPAPGPRDRIVFASRLVPLKGPDLLLRAWQRIAARHEDVHLEIIGDGARAPGLHARVRDEEIPRVTFTGQVDGARIRQSLDRAIVTAHPSQCHENSPFAVRESLMAGVPALVSEIGGMPEMVGPMTGWTVPHDDIDAWAAGLDTALRSRLVASPGLVETVMERTLTAEDHLGALLEHYGTLPSPSRRRT